MDDKDSYSEAAVHQIIQRIPVIIKNFKAGVSVEILARQMQCSTEIIERIVRLGFVAHFEAPVIDECESE